jgi:nitrate reductase NapD
MTAHTPAKSPDRRAFISGAWTAAPVEIASVLVQAMPDSLSATEEAITALAGCEIHGRDPRGKLVVVIEAADAGALGTTLTAISLLPHVLSATLVYHAIDAAEAASTEDPA